MNKDSKKKERVLKVEIYTDGSLKKIGNITFGGWAFIVTKDNQIEFISSGNSYDTTNQRMELTAVLEALRYIKTKRRPSEKVIIYSDSAYFVNCYLQEWYLNWQSNGWRNSKKEDVANKDLWLEIIPYFDDFWYDFRKVKGHDEVFWNNKCDEIAQKESQTIKDSWRGTENAE